MLSICDTEIFNSLSFCCISGSHGGRGGCPRGFILEALDAQAYGSYHSPEESGSGGGGTGGGAGGGAVKIISTSVNIDGIVSVNGQDATSGLSGGGSGGSIFIDCGHITGGGVLSARGGKGIGGGGGGSGGRIVLQHNTQDFTGEAIADGGITGRFPFCSDLQALADNNAQNLLFKNV